ncbi:MAG TPA: hypothetical protein VEX36_06930 [Thermoleophilaceae bacterium]|nr:hypothetical protein [Thermoleophilaceae bacterium]
MATAGLAAPWAWEAEGLFDLIVGLEAGVSSASGVWPEATAVCCC